MLRVSEGFENPQAEQQAREAAAYYGLPYFLSNGSIAPIR